MTTTSFTMKRQPIAGILLAAIFAVLSLSSCKKDQNSPVHPSSHNAEVLDKWMTLQLRLMRNATGVPNHGFSRHFAYSGVAAVEALAPGYLNHAAWQQRWNGLTGLPQAGNKNNYHYPANVNAAMAAINRSFFPNASAADKSAIDSLETALNAVFQTSQSQAILDASNNFGKAVAAAVFSWAETDGYKNANNPYSPPTGPGLWKPTPPANAAIKIPAIGCLFIVNDVVVMI